VAKNDYITAQLTSTETVINASDSATNLIIAISTVD